MKSKEEIVQILKENLSDVYCDTCGSPEGAWCEDCYRKNMNWGISDNFAEQLAELIIK